MQLSYTGKKPTTDILDQTVPAVLETVGVHGDNSATQNQLIQGDNLHVLQALLRQGIRVDLIYIDPPFARNTTFRAGVDRVATISARTSDDVAYYDKRTGAAFLEFLRERVILLRELLSETGSIYVHIDDKIGHYVKVMMDEVFGRANFRNDISRIKCNPKNFSRNAFGNVKDVILFYTKSSKAEWTHPTQQAQPETIERLFPKMDKRGRRYTTNPLHAPGETKAGESGKAWKGLRPPPGRHWRYSHGVLDQLDRDGLIEWSASGNPRRILYADDHLYQKVQDIWQFKDSQKPVYPTEKNLDLLKLIISASSKPGQLVLDAFCGSGTTLVAAQMLNRRWIGVDESDVAIKTAVKRLSALQNTDRDLLFSAAAPSFIVKRQTKLRAELSSIRARESAPLLEERPGVVPTIIQPAVVVSAYYLQDVPQLDTASNTSLAVSPAPLCSDTTLDVILRYA